MSGADRRSHIIEAITTADTPVSGTELARRFQVSRQVIVQDIALLRAANHDILSTPKGYIMPKAPSVRQVFQVNHRDDQIREELNAVVDLGGRVLDVFVQHEVYGTLRAELNIRSRRDVDRLVEDIASGKSSPLKNLTSSYHCHTVEADKEEDLHAIEKALFKKKMLIRAWQTTETI